MKREPDVRYVVPENLTEEQISEAKERLHEIARLLGRISANACHELGIRFDMDDPEVAREVMKMTFEAVFYSSPPSSRSKRKARAGARRAVVMSSTKRLLFGGGLRSEPFKSSWRAEPAATTLLPSAATTPTTA